MSNPPVRTSRRAAGEGSPSIDPRTGRHLFRSRTLVPGQLITGRGGSAREAKANARERAAHILAGRPSGKPETVGEMLQAWLILEAAPNYADRYVSVLSHTRDPISHAATTLRSPRGGAPAEPPPNPVSNGAR